MCHLLPRAVDDPFWIRGGGREVEKRIHSCVVNPAWPELGLRLLITIWAWLCGAGALSLAHTGGG